MHMLKLFIVQTRYFFYNKYFTLGSNKSEIKNQPNSLIHWCFKRLFLCERKQQSQYTVLQLQKNQFVDQVFTVRNTGTLTIVS